MTGDSAQVASAAGLPPMAVPMTVKMPEPMTAPTPRAVSEMGPRVLRRACSGRCGLRDELVDGLGGEDLTGQGNGSSGLLTRCVEMTPTLQEGEARLKSLVLRNGVRGARVEAEIEGMHRSIEPSILYFGTPVVLLSTLNPGWELEPGADLFGLVAGLELHAGDGGEGAHGGESCAGGRVRAEPAGVRRWRERWTGWRG